MNCFNPLRSVRSAAAAMLATAVSLLGGCTTYSDSTLGYDMAPEEQRMEIRHLTFKKGEMEWYNHTGDKKGEYTREAFDACKASLYRTDSVRSSNIGYGYIGVERSDTFGIRSAGFASSIMFMNALDTLGFGYLPIFDTLSLMLDVQIYGKDSLQKVEYNVFALNKPLVGEGSVLNPADSICFVNCKMENAYNPAEPLFTFTFPDPGNGIYPSSLYVNLIPVKGDDGKISAATWEFVRRLMLIPADTSDPEWDGYARDTEGVYDDDSTFAEKFFGIYIEPKDPATAAENRRGTLFATDLTASGLVLQGRNRNPKDPTLIQDTVGMSYYFSTDYTTIGNLSANRIRHDYTKGMTNGTASLLAGKADQTDKSVDCELGYIEGVAGPVLELTFTDDFIERLRKTTRSGEFGEVEDFSRMAVNRCLLHLYIEGSDYDWDKTQGNAATIAPLLDKSLDRLGAYTSYKGFENIADYDYVYEYNYSTDLEYDGYLNRSRACYTLNISSYMQQLYNYASSLAEGADIDDSANAGYVSRTIYIAPEATNAFALDRTVLQTTTGDAPLHMELTYTLFKK